MFFINRLEQREGQRKKKKMDRLWDDTGRVVAEQKK